ncbi:uracil-DNA glycosylase [Spiroplasma endosymbiont of Aspidapion aeneum]|uniref:uracil-DNA glycosylase n=1 Tax=Spiroplasma endosymbiont of Aspidapion aeneum TaxID=3066276 RepID=UPI00313C5A8B
MKKSWDIFFKESKINNDINILINKIYNQNIKVFPPKDNLFNIFNLVEDGDVKVVIIGQDPYHRKDQANGIAFSVNNNIKTPPSLQNIFKELDNDLNINHFKNNDLSEWVRQGVLLINTVWTVNKNQPNSCKNMGWENITKKILLHLFEINKNIIFCLWGKYAKNVFDQLNIYSNNLIVSGHPSPFSYYKYFKDSKPFSKINSLLLELKKIPIFWEK